jgi:hypothetical protein
MIKQNFILVQSDEVSDAEKKFWHRVEVLKKVLREAIHKDKKISKKNSAKYYSWQQIFFKWKLISLMKECEFKI